jgi:hypothetical protein
MYLEAAASSSEPMAVEIFFGAWLLSRAATHVQDPQPVVVRLDVPDAAFVHPDDGVGLRLSRPLTAAEGRLAVVIRDVDWTGLFREDGDLLRYAGGRARLPEGESPVTVYLVTPDGTWVPIATLTLHVTTPRGFERARVQPAADVTNLGQDAEQHQPDANVPPRRTFQDFTSHIGLSTEHVRGGTTVRTQTTVLGVSNEAQALRFGQMGARAPRVDLSDYVWAVGRNHLRFSFGTTTAAAERHLASNLATRGIGAVFSYAPFDVTVAALNAQTIVGFDNFLGITTRHNRIGLATVGAELNRRKPGAARIEASIVGGERLPVAGFTQGQINDVTRSRGVGLRFVRTDPTARLRFDAGAARSRSTNPDDPLLARGATLVAVRARTSDAEYVDASYDVVRNRRIGKSAAASMTGGYRFERVEPFFTSVGAPQGVRSDLLQQTASINGALAALSGQIATTWAHDNLGRVASLLTTDTGLTTANLAVQTGALGQSASAARWWPAVSYGLNASSQQGEDTPEHGGFVSASQIPNQQNTVHTLSANWVVAPWQFGYSLNRSVQDNRQPERERSDFVDLAQQVSVGAAWGARFDATATFGRERATSLEVGQIVRTLRTGLSVNWRPDVRQVFTVIGDRTTVADSTGGASNATNANVQYSYSLVVGGRDRKAPRLQLFGRWTWQSAGVLDILLHLPNNRRNWTVSSGATLALF